MKPARSARAAAPARAPGPRPAPLARAAGRFATNRASSPSPARARSARGWGKSSATPARTAGARAWWRASARSRSRFRRAWTQARGCASAGEGGGGGATGGPPGDLYVVLQVAEHDFFERRESNLYCSIPVSFPQAALGTEIRVPTLDGDTGLKIPAGTQSGTIFRLHGQGFPNLNGGGRGDLFVEVRVETPKKLTREQKRLVEQLAETLPAENRPAAKSSLFDRVKDIFG